MRTTPPISSPGASRTSCADIRTSAGVPPAPPEDSPKAVAGRARAAGPWCDERTDVRQDVTDRIVTMLAQGDNVFRARWTRAASRGVPRNASTGLHYHGANVLLLWDAAIEHAYPSNVWLTHRQAWALGAQVRRGERAVMCAHFERKAWRAEAPEDIDGVADRTRRPPGVVLCKPFWLFNVAQIAGLPQARAHGAQPAQSPAKCSPVEGAMRLIGGCRPDIRHGFARAAYAPRADRILMPDVERFASHEAYCATAVHALVHWSGHPQRLARSFGGRFGQAAHAFEALVAELGSIFVLGHIGLLEASVEGHAGCLQAWLHVLRRDPTAIFTAARHAGDAFAYLLARQMPSGAGREQRRD